MHRTAATKVQDGEIDGYFTRASSPIQLTETATTTLAGRCTRKQLQKSGSAVADAQFEARKCMETHGCVSFSRLWGVNSAFISV